MSRQAGTEAPPAAATDGVQLLGLESISIRVVPVSPDQLQPGGQLDIWVWDDLAGLWCIAPALVMPNPLGGATGGGVHFGSATVVGPFGRVAPIANGLSCSVDLYIGCTRRRSGELV